MKGSAGDLDALGGEAFVRKLAPDVTLIVTHGARSAHAVGAHGSVSAAANKTRCVDATGAGDAFFAGVLAVLVARDAMPGRAAWRDPAVFSDALRVGHMLGARVVSKVGAVTGLVHLAPARRLLGAKP